MLPTDVTDYTQASDAMNYHDFGAHGIFDDRSSPRSAQLWASHHHGTLGAIAAGLLGAGVAARAVLRRT